VQYNETDFAFISQLMEEEGYFYFFQHSPDGPELVIAESNIAFQTIPDSTLTFRPWQKDYGQARHAARLDGDRRRFGDARRLRSHRRQQAAARHRIHHPRCERGLRPRGVSRARAGVRHRRDRPEIGG
jgi:uncharacterized protein involved in type VI secretion and phage assembly